MSVSCCPTISYFSEEELQNLKKQTLPRHVAIIMDGNRRWVKKQIQASSHGLLSGHLAGAETLTNIVEACSELEIKALTVFGFSTENWGRSQDEIFSILEILEWFLEKNRQKMVEQGIRFHTIGDLTPFSLQLKDVIRETKTATQLGSKMDFIVALNYGGRDEIQRVIKKIMSDFNQNLLDPKEISEELVAHYLDTAPFGDPDLLIRTSGERRISNFLLWQLAYAEIYMTDTLWPDFTPRDLLKAVLDFQKRQRRKGK